MPGRALQELAGPRGLNAYLAGAGGAGMRGLARFLLSEGWRVWGSDRAGFHPADPLLAEGLRPLNPGKPPPPVSLAVRSAAVPESDPGFAAAVADGAEALRYAQMLGRISRVRPVMAVAGSHGKTTTTAWIAFGLRQAGIDAGYLVGGEVPQLEASSRWGDPSLPLVAESCEYDRSFLELSPWQAVLLNVDAEHPDTYPGGYREVKAAFCDFVGNVQAGGRVLAGPEAPDLSASTRARWESIPPLPPGTAVGLPGAHNRLNAAAAARAMREFGLEEAQVAEALRAFRGVTRRLEELGAWHGATVLSDYAHHPTEVSATLRAVRESRPGARLLVVFQPHQAVRFRAYHAGFAQALAPADALLLLEVYRVRDPDGVRASVRKLLPALPSTAGRPVAAAETQAAARERLAAWTQPGDILLFLGAGDIDAFARSLAGQALSAAAS